MTTPRLLRLSALALLLPGCALGTLIGYKLSPDAPDPQAAQELAGLDQSVRVTQKPDGLWKVEAASEVDAVRVAGYLQARDRMFQLDALRHVAQGRLSELVGNVPMGTKTSLDVDIFNRYLGLWEQARQIEATIPPDERVLIEAAVAGINAWIAEGRLSLEHRLLGVDEIEPWTTVDSLSVLRLFMFNLSHNYTRELRRLLLACAVGLDGMELIWPTDIEFPIHFLPDELMGDQRYDMPPAVVAEMRAALPDLCPTIAESDGTGPQRELQFAPEMGAVDTPVSLAGLLPLVQGLEASNNWVVAGSRTKSGMPILANDPHLAHMNPPIVWGIHTVTPKAERVGFALVGLHRITMGHNTKVAWGGTINNVDLQDLYVLAPASTTDGQEGYRYGDEVRPFGLWHETFRVKGADPVDVAVRTSHHGPLLNDMDPFLAARIPPTALRTVDMRDIGDVVAARDAAAATTVDDYIAAMRPFDSACINWVAADTAGNIAWTSPCRIPVRRNWLGTFPAPGWLPQYEWDGYYAKEAFVGSVTNPAQGYVATANNRPLPSWTRPTPYNNDPSSPNRFRQIKRGIEALDKITVADMGRLQQDVAFGYWSEVLATMPGWCDDARGAKAALCAWDHQASAESTTATMFVFLQHALLDRSMGQRLPGGMDGEFWRFIQDIPHFEQNLDWLLLRPADDAIWDLPDTSAREDKAAAFDTALASALSELQRRHGTDPSAWAWGTVRPYVLKHLFGDKAALASLLNSPAYPGRGLPNTVFKNQFTRAKRAEMHPGAGPAFRFVIDMSEPRGAVYNLAGGESGWPNTPHFADGVGAWIEGRYLPLEAEGGTLTVFRPQRSAGAVAAAP